MPGRRGRGRSVVDGSFEVGAFGARAPDRQMDDVDAGVQGVAPGLVQPLGGFGVVVVREEVQHLDAVGIGDAEPDRESCDVAQVRSGFVRVGVVVEHLLEP